MKIAQIAPIVERVPPGKYGGTERVVSALTEELVRRGHEVTLFATGDSITSAHLVSVYPHGTREANVDDHYWALLNIGKAFLRADEFDIIHDHTAPFSLPIAHFSGAPSVMTMHGPFTADNTPLFRAFTGAAIASISRQQARGVPGIHHVGTVYNGLAMEHYPFGLEPDPYLLFVGRISREKGVHIAAEVARRLGMRLIIAAKLDAVDRPYFEKSVRPLLSRKIEWIGEVDEEERNRLMAHALCFLHPVLWREPFGLTLIEAAACGCPVIAFDRGSIPEIIAHGETGFVVSDIDAMIEAIRNLDTIDRAQCRAQALSRFSASRMTDAYVRLYSRVLAEAHAIRRPLPQLHFSRGRI